MKPKRVQAYSTEQVRLQDALKASDWVTLTRLCRQTLRKNKAHLGAHRLLGFSLNKQRQTAASLVAFKQAVVFHPEDPELLINYGNMLIEHALNQEALPLLEAVCKQRPKQAISWIKLAQCCYLLGLHEKGFAAGLKSAELASSLEEQVAALTQKAIHRRELGQVREAVKDCEAAIALQPADPSNHTNRLLFMLADPEVNAAQMAQAAHQYAEVFEPPLKSQWPDFKSHHGDPWRKLKIGFISPDFRVHAVMYFVEGILAQLDRRQFEVYAFFTYPRDDHVTERVQRHADHFIRLAGLTPKEQANRVRNENIDILIDLAGHTGHNALLAMAHRAAPVQASWVGFPGTTGLTAIDYVITDMATDPPGAESNYSERLYRLPQRLCCYRPMSRQPLWRYQPRYLVSQLPALINGFITFGSCNNLGKLTDEVLSTWAAILAATPNSQLLIEGKNFSNHEFVQSYKVRCEHLGIPSDRLKLVALNTNNQYLTYHQIDIALDPFPLNGGTTSMDVLWMGVPFVALEGESFKSRLSTGILHYLGRTEWLARSKTEYVGIACELAQNLPRLQEIREGLRREVEESTLMREDLFCDVFTTAMRDMWLTWLRQEHEKHPLEFKIEAWHQNPPAAWSAKPAPGVGLAPGHRVSLTEAHQELQRLVELAKLEDISQQTNPNQIENPKWIAVTELAEFTLTAKPHDAVALACLAEVEFAHGHSEFAVTYLNYAVASMK
jgi:protein O-GlcNAc transferase